MKFLPTTAKHNGIDERLQKVLEIVDTKRPLFEYKIIARGWGGEAEAPATKVSVWQHGQRLGKIDVDHRKHSKTKDQVEKWFAVESPYIDTKRGRANTKFSKDAETAAKIVIDVFAKQPLAVLASEAIESSGRHLESAYHRKVSAFTSSLPSHSADVYVYFTEMYMGNTTQPPKSVMSRIDDKTVKAYKEYVVARGVMEHLKKGNGYLAHYMADGTFLVVDVKDHKTAAKIASTYEMPAFMQEKITMLKLMDNNQFAENIGVKSSMDFIGIGEETPYYFIVGGETVVQ